MTISEICLEKLSDKNEETVRLVYCPGWGTPLFGQDEYVTLNKPWYSYSRSYKVLDSVYHFTNFSNSIVNRLSFRMKVF